MPSRNVIKEYAPNSYYHIYNRGVARQPIFIDVHDKQYFLKIIARHLDANNTDKKRDGVIYRKFTSDIDMISYCLMGNHFHLFAFIKENPHALKEFMQSLTTAYSMYFNKKYKRVGSLFQGVYKASRISDESYLTHITRYIHLNPRNYQAYRYSSLKYYYQEQPPVWLKPEHITSLFADQNEYNDFLADYEDSLRMLDSLKNELADTVNIYPAKRHR